MRRNTSQTAKRRSHHALHAGRVVKCECGALHLPHRACPKCGKYDGRVVIDMVAAQKRVARRTKRKEQALRESGQIVEAKEEKAAA